MKMLTLSFKPAALPRTMTRDEWRAADRWRRLAERALSRNAEATAAAFEQAQRDLASHGQSFMIVGPGVCDAVPFASVLKR
ncbi:MAG TPA: hypothetical protein VIU82_22060 [Bosea sp. (in: a-proteobacteria)]